MPVRPHTTPPGPTRETPDARIARSRQALLRAILDLLREGAGDHLTISAICERAGVSRPTFYQHFSSPHALLAAAVTERLDSLLDRLSGEVGPRPDDDGHIPALVAAMLAELEDAGAASAYRATLGDVSVIRRLQATFEGWVGDRLQAAYHDAPPTSIAFAAGGITSAFTHRFEDATASLAEPDLGNEIWRMVQGVLGPIPHAGDQS